MNTFAEKANRPQQETSAHASRLGMVCATVGPEPYGVPHPALEAGPRLAAGRFGHNYSRIPVYAGAPPIAVTRGDKRRVARKCDCGGTCPKCEAQDEGRGVALQGKHVRAGNAGLDDAPAIVHEVVGSRGKPLDAETRAFFEPRFGFDFDGVRVHTGARAAESAQTVQAVAYTVGRDVVFGSGEYTPQSEGGRKLLAHELTHVVQQSRSPGRGAGRLPIIPAHDPSEREADRAAEAVLQTGAEATVPSQPRGETPAPHGVQRQEMAQELENPQGAATEEPTGSLQAAQPAGTAAGAGGLILDDDATQAGPGQMRKSEFLSLLHDNVCATADDALAATGRSAQGCPYIERWIAFYRDRNAAHVERALRKYAPEAANATSARDYIPMVSARVRMAVKRWVATGEITGVPEEFADQISGGGILGAVGGAISSAVSSVASGIGSVVSAIGGIFGKAREGGLRRGDPASVRAELGDGQPLGAGIRSRMEPVFGHDFSRVRVHAGEDAACLSERLNSRAFTVGEHVAFGRDEYRPETLYGDALIAHELAHVVQQSGAGGTAGPSFAGGANYDALEQDADRAAEGALGALWGGSSKAIPRMRSGLSLQRCGATAPRTTTPTTPQTPTAQANCPTSSSIDQIIPMNDIALSKGWRTAYGITAVIRMLPDNLNWDGKQIPEHVTPHSSTCPATWTGMCTGGSTFPVGSGKYSTILGDLPAIHNCFYDHHSSRWKQESRLHDPGQNPAGLDTCEVVCDQDYTCDGAVIGRYQITRRFRKDTYQGRDVTIVDTTKVPRP